jgi:DNA-binding transcriptional ArsR family regulator
LAHASRRQILMTVQFRGGMSAGDIAQRFHYAWPTISRHLGVLKSAELLIEEKQGRTRLYRVNRERLALVLEWLSWFDLERRPQDESQLETSHGEE